MPTLTLRQIITQPEGQTFDRKSIKIAAKDLAVTVVAFANADGGTIAIVTRNPEPKYEKIGFMVMGTAYSSLYAENNATFSDETTDSSNTAVKTVEKTVEKILALIKENPKITQTELTNKTGLSRRGVEWNIQQLKYRGLLTRIGPDKGGYWQVNENIETHG